MCPCRKHHIQHAYIFPTATVGKQFCLEHVSLEHVFSPAYPNQPKSFDNLCLMHASLLQSLTLLPHWQSWKDSTSLQPIQTSCSLCHTSVVEICAVEMPRGLIQYVKEGSSKRLLVLRILFKCQGAEPTAVENQSRIGQQTCLKTLVTTRCWSSPHYWVQL